MCRRFGSFSVNSRFKEMKNEILVYLVFEILFTICARSKYFGRINSRKFLIKRKVGGCLTYIAVQNIFIQFPALTPSIMITIFFRLWF